MENNTLDGLLIDGTFPNFDCMSNGDRAAWLDRAASYMSADTVWGAGHTAVHHAVMYVAHVLQAYRFRIQGKIPYALRCERMAEMEYQSIPAALRW